MIAVHTMTRAKRVFLRLEEALVGPLRPDLRHNIRIEIGWGLAHGAFATVLAFMSVVLRQLGAPAEWLAFNSSAAYLGNVASWLGLALFRQGHLKRRMTAMWLASRGSLVLAALITGYPWLLVLAALYHLLEGLPGPAHNVIVRQVYPAAERGRLLTTVRTAIALPMLALGPVAGWLLDVAGYRVLFPVAGVIGMVSALIFARLRVDETTLQMRDPGPRTNLWRLVGQDRRFGLYLLGFLLFGLGALIPAALFPIVQVDRLRLSYAAIGWLNLSAAATRAASYVFWGRLSDRLGGIRCLQAAFAINVLVLVPYALATTGLVGGAGGWILLPSVIAGGIASSAIELAFFLALMQVAPSDRVMEYAAAQSMLIGGRGIVAPFIGVGLIRLGMGQTAIFGVGIALVLLAALVMQFVRREPSRSMADGVLP